MFGLAIGLCAFWIITIVVEFTKPSISSHEMIILGGLTPLVLLLTGFFAEIGLRNALRDIAKEREGIILTDKSTSMPWQASNPD